MGDRFLAPQLHPRDVASLGRAAACAQALGGDAVADDADLTPFIRYGDRPPGDWSEVHPEDRYVLGQHPPAWPDLPTPDAPASTPDWALRLAAWLRETDSAPTGLRAWR